jgi:hypothetical protein
MSSPVSPIPLRARLVGPLFTAHVLACMVLGVFNTGGGCGPGGDPLPPTSIICTPEGAMDVEAPPDPTQAFIWVGTTDDSGGYRAVQPNETLHPVSGPQGGSHVWGAARLYAPDDTVWTVRFDLHGEDGGLLGSVTVAADSCAGGTVEISYVTVFLEQSPPFSALLSVDAIPSQGSSQPVHAEVPVMVQ